MKTLKTFQQEANRWMSNNLYWIVPLFFLLLTYDITDRQKYQREAKQERKEQTKVIAAGQQENRKVIDSAAINLRRKLDSINAIKK